jgi:hypothetical protein
MTKIQGYSTKYALTRGIEPVTVEPGASNGGNQSPYMYGRENGWTNQYIREQTFFETEADAKKRAIAVARAKIKSAEKQIAKLNRLIEEWSN